MATQRASIEYTDQPYFNKATERPQVMEADNTNSAPSGAKVTRGPWGKTQVAYKSSNAPVRSAQSTDEIFAAGYAQAGIQSANLNQKPDQTRKARTVYTAPTNVPSVPRTVPTRIPSIKRNKKVSVKKMLLARVRVTTANTWIGSWAIFWYLAFQIPMAVLSTAGLGIAYSILASISNILSEDGMTWFQTIGGQLYTTLSQAVNALVLLRWGISFDPMLLFITPFALIFILGLLQLIIAWFVYSVMRINSLSGKAAGLKSLMFVLAGVGYAIPILNLFPLIFLWMIVVWMYPK